jgi:hypothetical protein
MKLNQRAQLLGAAVLFVATLPAVAQYSRPPRDMVDTYRPTGGYCDQSGCPDRFWRYRIYYGPVFFHGRWFKGPVYVKDDRGRHYFWVQGGWHRDEWHEQRPSWARNSHFGPALPREYYQANNFGGGGQRRDEGRNHGDNQGYQDYQNYEAQGEYSRDYGALRSGSNEADRNQYGGGNGSYQQGDRRGYRQDSTPSQGQYNQRQYDNGNGNYQPGYQQRAPSNVQGQIDGNGPNGRLRDNTPGQGGAVVTGQQPTDGRYYGQGRNGNGQGVNNNAQPGTITVAAATYGASCKQPIGNVTKFLADACNGKTTCDYVVRYQTFGDPAPGCGKDFSVQWTCSAGTGGTASAPGESGLGSKVTLQCTANGR